MKTNPHEILLIKAENENPDKAFASLLDDHKLHIALHTNIDGMEKHIKEHEELAKNPDYELLFEIMK